ncbi:hypothetical protein AKO1_007735 [Acrasis kona]|uniref:RRM domain-containing protein n=1 Tax=Acrasis kona TaxID=1008807 RepID=A0AAW2YRF3_9EUKA
MSGFAVTEDINSDDDYELNDDVESDESQNESDDEDVQRKRIKPIKDDEESTELKPAKAFKPLDYNKMRSEQNLKGVIFVTKPLDVGLIERFSNEKAMQRFLQEYGEISRVKASYEVRNRRRYLSGFYVEFEKKSIAKRVALSLNGNPLSRHDSRTMNVKYIPDFNWNSIGELEERSKMITKMRRVEAEKELRNVQKFKKQTKWSNAINERKNNNKTDDNKKYPKLEKVSFTQKKFKRYNKDQNAHMNFLNIF